MRALTIVIALLLGLVGLLMSLCGGGFLLGTGFDSGIAVIAVPSIVAGLLLIWGCRVLLRRIDQGKAGDR